MTQSKYTAKKEFGHVIVVAKHPAQLLFQRLLEAVEIVSFLRLKTHTSEEEFLKLLKLAPDKNTAIIFDDVRRKKMPEFGLELHFCRLKVQKSKVLLSF